LTTEGWDGVERPQIRPVHLRPLMLISVTVDEPLVVDSQRRYVPLTGGTFEGNGLRGIVLPGTDWQRVRPDGSLELDAHYALRTDDGLGIEVRSTGVRRVDADVLRRLADGEQVDPDDYYFRTHILLRTTAPSLAHLDGLVGISTGQRDAALVHIHVHEVL
jgi:Protein of unknown function (DUF3237)